jgi:hypothetical protein
MNGGTPKNSKRVIYPEPAMIQVFFLRRHGNKKSYFPGKELLLLQKVLQYCRKKPPEQKKDFQSMNFSEREQPFPILPQKSAVNRRSFPAYA